MNAIQWVAEQVFRTDLPGDDVSAKPWNRPKDAGETIRRAVDRQWRTRNELAELTDTGASSVSRVLASMVEAGEAEVMPGTRVIAAKFRRAR